MKKLIHILFIVLVPQIIIAVIIYNYQNIKKEGNLDELRDAYAEVPQPSVDHGKFASLQQDFETPHEVTEACLTCHTERGQELLNSPHFKWERETFIPGRGVMYLGKNNMINNLCTGIAGSEQTCTRCHAGYGYYDTTYNFHNEKNIDCLVCHDNSGIYKKAKGSAGYPAMGEDAPDYGAIAHHIGRPNKQNCGTCHFTSSGGNNVKHGDLEIALLNTSKQVDVHMAKNGLDMECVDCHSAENHVMKGRYYGISSRDYNRATCEQCHNKRPHEDDIINEHTIKVACQTCHIPKYAKVNATKMYWDWSTACNLKDGNPYHELDSMGNETYLSIKGSFTWKRNVKPDYKFFNGTADHYLLTDVVDTFPVQINTLFGSYDDRKSKIWPVKIHRGKQPYDPQQKRIIQAKLWDPEPGNGALWIDYDWDAALKAGMDYVDLPYSGQYEFVETEMYLPLNHMVSPATESVSCAECHNRNNSRMAGLGGFYMPGKDRNDMLDLIGWILILGSLAGVIVHGGFRFAMNRKQKH